MSEIRFCDRCGASLGRDAGFCANCCAPRRQHVREVTRKRARADCDARRRGLAIGVVFAGALLAMVALLWIDVDVPEFYFVAAGLDVALGFAAVSLLGRSSWRRSFGRRPDLRGFALACAVPIGSLAVVYGYVELLQTLAGVEGDSEPGDSELALPLMFLIIAVLTPLTEEWLCRGVMWLAIRPLVTRWSAIVATALLFGFLHGLNGGYILEVPHRFATGLLLGWLRATSGSIWPGVLAHALHNGAVLVIDG